MQQDQPQLYDSLIKILNSDERRVVQEIILQADAFNMAPAQLNGGHRWLVKWSKQWPRSSRDRKYFYHIVISRVFIFSFCVYLHKWAEYPSLPFRSQQSRSHGYEWRIQRIGKRPASVIEKRDGFGGSFDRSTVEGSPPPTRRTHGSQKRLDRLVEDHPNNWSHFGCYEYIAL